MSQWYFDKDWRGTFRSIEEKNWILTKLSSQNDKKKTNASSWRRVIGELCIDEKQLGGTF